MDYRTLGKTGLEVSPLTIGAWQLAGPLTLDNLPDGHPDPGRENVLRLIRELGDLGINAIDTAEQYGGGESERRVGDALFGQRERWIVSTKFGFRVGPNNTRVDDSSAPTILPSLEGSLRRLRTDYIDIYLYHCAPNIDDLEAGREVLERAREQGKIRFYGISTNKLPLIEAMQAHGMVEVLQYASNLLEDAQAVREFAHAHQIGTQLRAVIAQGRLSGRYFAATPVWRADDNRTKNFPGHDFRRYAPLQAVLPEGYTIVQAAIRWVLDQPGNHTICMGAKTLEDYRTAIAALELPALTEETRRQLRECADAIMK